MNIEIFQLYCCEASKFERCCVGLVIIYDPHYRKRERATRTEVTIGSLERGSGFICCSCFAHYSLFLISIPEAVWNLVEPSLKMAGLSPIHSSTRLQHHYLDVDVDLGRINMRGGREAPQVYKYVIFIAAGTDFWL